MLFYFSAVSGKKVGLYFGGFSCEAQGRIMAMLINAKNNGTQEYRVLSLFKIGSSERFWQSPFSGVSVRLPDRPIVGSEL